MIVVDASALTEVLLRSAIGLEAEKRLIGAGDKIFAPQTIDVEVAHALRRMALHGALAGARGLEALRDIDAMGIIRIANTLLIERVWELRHNLSAYDAAYIALAELLGTTLLTRDRRLASAPGHEARIELL